MPRRSRFARGGFVYHMLNPGASGHAIVFFESQPTIPGAPGFEDVLEEAKDFASDTVTRLATHRKSPRNFATSRSGQAKMCLPMGNRSVPG